MIGRVALIGSATLLGTVIGWSGQGLAQQQPRMQAALESLRQARIQLLNATADKGGYRKQALIDVENAIMNVEKGMRFDTRNPSRNDPYLWRNR